MFNKTASPVKKPETWGETFRSFATAALLAFSFQIVAIQTFVIPSGSMKPNLLIGDFLFVSKFTYGYSRYSIFFSPPLFEGRLFGREPKRGEVVVFRAPHKPSEDWIKRCVGLPGDRVQMRGGILFLNGEACHLEKVEPDFRDHLYIDYHPNGREERIHDETGVPYETFIQTLPTANGSLKHLIIKEKSFGTTRLDNTPEIHVPAGYFFMMGDNRDGSDDSRNQQNLGLVPYDHLIGRAEMIAMSTSARWWEIWRWVPGLRYDRFFRIIR